MNLLYSQDCVLAYVLAMDIWKISHNSLKLKSQTEFCGKLFLNCTII